MEVFEHMHCIKSVSIISIQWAWLMFLCNGYLDKGWNKSVCSRKSYLNNQSALCCIGSSIKCDAGHSTEHLSCIQYGRRYKENRFLLIAYVAFQQL